MNRRVSCVLCVGVCATQLRGTHTRDRGVGCRWDLYKEGRNTIRRVGEGLFHKRCRDSKVVQVLDMCLLWFLCGLVQIEHVLSEHTLSK